MKSRARVSCFTYEDLEDRISKVDTFQMNSTTDLSNVEMDSSKGGKDKPAGDKEIVFHVSSGKAKEAEHAQAPVEVRGSVSAESLVQASLMQAAMEETDEEATPEMPESGEGLRDDAVKANDLVEWRPLEEERERIPGLQSGFDAALFRCTAEPCSEPPHPMVQADVPHRARRHRSQQAVAVAVRPQVEEVRRIPFPEICLCQSNT